jgi:hypothetical protein
LASAYTGTPASRSSISADGRGVAEARDGEGEGEGIRAQGGGGGRARGREERNEVKWAWMGRKGFGMLGLGLGLASGLEEPAAVVVVVGFLSHGNWKWEGMSTAVGDCSGEQANTVGTGQRRLDEEEDDERKGFRVRFHSWAQFKRISWAICSRQRTLGLRAQARPKLNRNFIM